MILRTYSDFYPKMYSLDAFIVMDEVCVLCDAEIWNCT